MGTQGSLFVGGMLTTLLFCRLVGAQSTAQPWHIEPLSKALQYVVNSSSSLVVRLVINAQKAKVSVYKKKT